MYLDPPSSYAFTDNFRNFAWKPLCKFQLKSILSEKKFYFLKRPAYPPSPSREGMISYMVNHTISMGNNIRNKSTIVSQPEKHLAIVSVNQG